MCHHDEGGGGFRQGQQLMETPIADFVRRYADSGMVRAHVPGHKGKPFLGCEALDITEIQGADSLYEADGIIRRSESCAGELFGSGRTVLDEGTFALLIKAFSLLKQFAEAVCSADTVGETEAEMTITISAP